MASLLMELLHDVDRRVEEIALELRQVKVPNAVKTYRDRIEQLASHANKTISLIISDPDLNDPAFAVNYFRDYKGLVRLVQELENLPLLVLRRFSKTDCWMTTLLDKICEEIGYPFPNRPICSGISSQYYWTAAGMDLIFVPCLEADHLLGLPDIYHELGHILLFRKEKRLVFPALAIVDRHFDRLVADWKKANVPAGSIMDLEGYRHRWRQTWVLEFGADMIATFTAGPVFGWCNIRTSCNLGGGLYSGNETHPADDMRATMIGHMLRRMGFGATAAEIETRWAELLNLSGEARPQRYEAMYPKKLLEDLADFFYAECKTAGLVEWQQQSEVITVGASIDAAWEEFRKRPDSFGQFQKEQLDRLRGVLGDAEATEMSAA